MSPKLPRLPPQAQLARWAVKYGPLVLPYAKRLYDQGRFRQLSIMHARTLADGTFSWEMVDGDRVWVVWSGDEVVTTYPDRPDLQDREGHPFPAARRDRREDPHDIPVQRAKRRLASLTLPTLGRQDEEQDEDVTDGSTGRTADEESPTDVVADVETAVEAELHDSLAGPPADRPPGPEDRGPAADPGSDDRDD